MRKIELLAPAKDLACGIAAIDSGADAVYIGGPSYGARVNAPNTLEEIAELCNYAHIFGAKVHVTLNTILNDTELAEARKLAFKLYDIGVDALIIQDLGLLNGELPPLELHASTQQDNSTPEKVEFLEKLGFKQVVLARELSINEIKSIKSKTNVTLEGFIHGALCVGVSGRCYLSASVTKRSANRGECAQLCRVMQSLYTIDGTELAHDKYLLSMKDLNQTQNVEELIDAGISSFKIEGRLKDESYVRNVVAHYRQILDGIIAKRTDITRSSFGTSTYNFTPDVSKSFNRGFTEYNTHEIKDNYANFNAPGFVGVKVGTVKFAQRHKLIIDLLPNVTLHNGDSLNFYNLRDELEGFRVSTASGENGCEIEIYQGIPFIKDGATIYRNKDAQFEYLLSLGKKASDRKIDIKLCYEEHLASDASNPNNKNSITLSGIDELGYQYTATHFLESNDTAKDPAKLTQNITDKLSRLGDSQYKLANLELKISNNFFVPISIINNLRREVIDNLNKQKQQRIPYFEQSKEQQDNNPNSNIINKDATLPKAETELGYMANIYNQKSKEFYLAHGMPLNNFEEAYETYKHKEKDRLVLVSKHCLRYCFNRCPKYHKFKAEDLILKIGKNKFKLTFDCKNCRMLVWEENAN